MINYFKEEFKYAKTENIITMLESIIYNQYINSDELTEYFQVLYDNLNEQDFEFFPKLINLIIYSQKQKNQEIFDQLTEKINNITFIIVNLNQKNILIIQETLNYVFLFNSMNQKNKKLLQFLHEKNDKILQQYFQGNKQIIFSDALQFMTKFQEQSMYYLHKNILQKLTFSYQQQFNSQDISFQDQIKCLYFLQQNSKQFQFPQEIIETLIKQSSSEKNLLILIKLLDILSKIEYKVDIIQIENQIVQNSKRLQKPQKILIQLLQHLVRSKQGQDSTFFYLFDYFTSQFQKLNYTDLFVKLIPSVALKTQDIFKIYQTNITTHNSAIVVKKKQIAKEQKEILINFWQKISEFIQKSEQKLNPKVYPSIVFYFTYVNIFEESFQDLFVFCHNQIQKNLDNYDQKQLAQFIYAFGRNKHIPIQKTLLKAIPLVKIQEDIIQNINIYWGLGKQQILSQRINQEVEKNILNNFDNLSQESFVQFLISYGRFYGFQRTNKIQSILKQKILKTNFNSQQLFQLSQSLIIMGIFEKDIWEHILQQLLLDQDKQFNDQRNITYLYSIFFNLQLFNNQIPLKKVEEILKPRFNSMLKFIFKYKKQFKSNFEKQIIEKIKIQIQIQLKKENIIFYSDLNEELIENLNFDDKNTVIPFTVDFQNGNQIFEINGPTHYFVTEEGYFLNDGETDHKKRILEKLNFQYFEFNDYESKQYADSGEFVNKVLNS